MQGYFQPRNSKLGALRQQRWQHLCSSAGTAPRRQPLSRSSNSCRQQLHNTAADTCVSRMVQPLQAGAATADERAVSCKQLPRQQFQYTGAFCSQQLCNELYRAAGGCLASCSGYVQATAACCFCCQLGQLRCQLSHDMSGSYGKCTVHRNDVAITVHCQLLPIRHSRLSMSLAASSGTCMRKGAWYTALWLVRAGLFVMP